MPKILPDGTRDWTEEMNEAMADEDTSRVDIRRLVVPLRKKLGYGEITQEEFDRELKKIQMEFFGMDEDSYQEWKKQRDELIEIARSRAEGK